MDDIIKYINTVLGENVLTRKMQENKAKLLPLYITNTFTLREGKLLGKSLIFAIQKANEHYTPDQYKNIIGQIEKKLNKPVVLILNEIEAYNKKRLIEKRVNFIIANRQLFLPSLLIDLKDYIKETKPKGRLRPISQLLVLYHIFKEQLNNMTYTELANKFNYSYLSISRAAENLKKHEVCDIQGRKTKKFYFGENTKELWERAWPYFKTPILRKVFIEGPIPVNNYYKSNLEALAHYSNISSERTPKFAISNRTYQYIKEMQKVHIYEGTDEDYNMEVWRYDPGVLEKNGFVDPLSLCVVFRNNEDERIQMALEQIIKTYIW